MSGAPAGNLKSHVKMTTATRRPLTLSESTKILVALNDEFVDEFVLSTQVRGVVINKANQFFIVNLLSLQMHNQRDLSDFWSKKMRKNGSTYGWHEWSDQAIAIDQLDNMIVDLSLLVRFGSQI